MTLLVWTSFGRAERASPDLSRYVRYGFTIENTRNVRATNVVLFVQLPVYQSETQRTLECKVVPEAEILRDGSGNQVAKIDFSDIPPLATRLVEIEARIVLGRNAEFGLDAENPTRYLQPEEFVESDHADIQALANKAPEGSVPDMARWFEEEVRRTIKPAAMDPADRGALWALANSKGDCTEQSYLFVALCRARGVPARVVGGYRCDGPCLLLPASYHNWAEFHDGESWIRVDLTPDPAGPEYVAMKIHTPKPDARTGFFHRAKLVAGEGVEAKMNGLR
jgi:transglutaminase-like putative cysteine protease